MTDGIATYGYDVLGRVVSVLMPDGSSVSTSYTNNCSTAIDEVGKSRQSCFDGLGRLTKVVEDPGSSPHLNYETDYTYDALDNLISVTHRGCVGKSRSQLQLRRAVKVDASEKSGIRVDNIFLCWRQRGLVLWKSQPSIPKDSVFT
jgi:YD repeat-containing protein